ncbi:MAG: hypothetical protein JOZ72_07220 [Alphaproteobacteria bacterium]|nr:hypothetical protein [Alphaproteobacteria bacterium]
MVPRLLIVLALLTAPALADRVPLTKGERNLDTAAGWALFKRPWISSPSSLEAGGGLGPLYDARACNECHTGGGAGTVAEGALGAGMVVRVGDDTAGADPTYGRQLQTHALPGFVPEADISFLWSTEGGLRAPKLGSPAFHYGAPATATHLALRRAPSLFGIGQLESVPDSEILKGSGKPAWLTGADGKRELGRWGWKATASGLPRQVEIAFQRDFGIATSGLPGAAGECTARETPCYGTPGPAIELPDNFRDVIVIFLRYLHAPDPRDEKAPGFALFRQTGCLSCHAVLHDAKGEAVHAYSDLMLHDLGPALADGIADGAAKPSEWRTAPLWDLGENLARGGLLHDGRARSIAEAVEWHGGEASQSRAAFKSLSPEKRKMIEDFLLGSP